MTLTRNLSAGPSSLCEWFVSKAQEVRTQTHTTRANESIDTAATFRGKEKSPPVARLSLLLCVAAVALWMRSYRARTAIEFQSGNALWEFASGHGRLCLNNGPKCAMERESYARERSRLFDECVRLDYQANSLRDRLRRGGADTDEIAAVEAKLARVKALGDANRKARAEIGW